MDKDLYFVAVKLFILDKYNRLLITKDKFGDWDIPGGRLRDVDFKVELKNVIARKMTEELGSEFKYELGKPVVFMRHEREEFLSDGKKELRRIFAIGYEAKYINGEIKLGVNHEKYEWVALKSFVPEDYFTGGWLEGVKQFKNLFR